MSPAPVPDLRWLRLARVNVVLVLRYRLAFVLNLNFLKQIFLSFLVFEQDGCSWAPLDQSAAPHGECEKASTPTCATSSDSKPYNWPHGRLLHDITPPPGPSGSLATSGTSVPLHANPAQRIRPACMAGASPRRKASQHLSRFVLDRNHPSVHSDRTRVLPASAITSPRKLMLDAPSWSAPYGGITHGARAFYRLCSRSPISLHSITRRRRAALWSNNAAFKCERSVSTTLSTDLSTGAHPGGLQRLDGHEGRQRLDMLYPNMPSGALRTSAGDCVHDGKPGVEVQEAYFSRSRMSSDGAAQLPLGQDIFQFSPPAKLSAGYAQLELLNESVGSFIRHTSGSRRRSANHSGSAFLRRTLSRSPRSDGTTDVSAVSGAVGGSREGSPAMKVVHYPKDVAGGQRDAASTSAHVAKGIAVFTDSMVRTTAPQGCVGLEDDGLQQLSPQGGDENLPGIREATSTGGVTELDSSKGLVGPNDVQLPEGHRWTANELTDRPAISGLFLSRKNRSEKCLGDGSVGECSRRLRERGLLARLRNPVNFGGGRIFKKDVMQPSYKKLFAHYDDGFASVPMSFAKNAIQAVPRFPSIARNMGEKIVDGGQQVRCNYHLATI